jgi:uncharacterized membrane protein YciS (DUF1049 family)
MGISVKIFPGVRIGVSKRGFNASVGPRIARIHTGPSGTRFSSGAGPVSVSGRIGRKTRTRRLAKSVTQSETEQRDETLYDPPQLSDAERKDNLARAVYPYVERNWQVLRDTEFLVELRGPNAGYINEWGFLGLASLLFLDWVYFINSNLLYVIAQSQTANSRIAGTVVIAGGIACATLVQAWRLIKSRGKIKTENKKLVIEVDHYGHITKHFDRH